MTAARHELTVTADHAGHRLDAVVGERLGLSRLKLKALFDGGHVRANGRRAKKGDLANAGDVLSVELPADSQGPVLVADPRVPLVVLKEDERLIFVDKPSGVPVHPLEPGETGTLANALVARWPQLAQVGDPKEAGLCHRLDIDTSGVVVVAKDVAAWQSLRAAFSEPGVVRKQYLALTCGPLADEGEIDVGLEHAGDHVRPVLDGGRPAFTQFTVLARSGPYALVQVVITTGVLHQVRAHLAAVGAPLLGDGLYGGPVDAAFPRVCLHAAALAVPHPAGGTLGAASPFPAELAAVAAHVGLPTQNR